MTYLIVQLQLFLLLAFVLGALLGWWLRHFTARRLEESLRADMAERNSRLGHIENERQEIKLLADAREGERDTARSEALLLKSQLEALEDKAAAADAEIEQLQSQLQASEQSIEALNNDLQAGFETEQQLRADAEELQGVVASMQQHLQQQEVPSAAPLHSDADNAAPATGDAGAATASVSIQLQQRDKELRRLTALLESQTAKTASALAARDQLLAAADAANG